MSEASPLSAQTSPQFLCATVLPSSPLLPAARCGCRLDGVDPEPGSDVLERLQSLLVRFVVVLHLADAPKESTHARAHKYDKLKEFKS